MTALDDTPDTARAADLDCAREAYRVFPIHNRPAFGAFAVNFLRERGLALAPIEGRTSIIEATEMLGEVTDLLAALTKRGLHWVPGENGQRGTLTEGQPEPPDLHVVFDCYCAVWQRDDDRAGDEGDPAEHWFGPLGTRRTWAGLQRGNGPMTPKGGIAPTTLPADDSEPF